MVGYVGIGIPCGIMEQQIGMNAFMAFIMSMTFYSGAGQFMIPSMWLASAPLASIIASVSFVNTRQLLYSAAFSPYFEKVARFIIEKDKASIGMLQRAFKIGFNRAARIMDQLADAGVVGEEEGTKPRKILMSEEQFEQFVEDYL